MARKKGISALTLVADLVMLLLVIYVGFLIYNKASAGVKDFTQQAKALTSFKDYDGDGLKDAVDPCPCGPDNSIHSIENQVQTYCKANFDSSTTCPTSYGFKWIDDQNTGKHGCYYQKSQCLDYLIAMYANDLKNNQGKTTT